MFSVQKCSISRFLFDKTLFFFPNNFKLVGENIYVADSTSDYCGRLIALEKYWELKLTFGEHLEHSLNIADISITPLSNIVILDVCQLFRYFFV